MSISVECECGKVVEVEMPVLSGNNQHMLHPLIVAGRKCPNPDCDKTILVELDININTADLRIIEDTKIDYDKICLENVIYFEGSPYEVARKTTKRTTGKTSIEERILILYLRSLSGRGNLIVEVTNTEFPRLLCQKGSKPYQTWTEDQLMSEMLERVE